MYLLYFLGNKLFWIELNWIEIENILAPIFLTHRGRDKKGRYFESLKCIFLTNNVLISIGISLKFVPKGPVEYIPSFVRIMAWRRPCKLPLSEQ